MNKDNFNRLGSQDSWKIVAFEAAVKMYGSFFRSYFRRKIGNREIARDLSQDFWVKVWESFKPHQYSQIKLLVYKANQVFVDEIRKQEVRTIVEHVPDFHESIKEAPIWQPNTEAEEQRFWDNFWEGFGDANLTEDQKKAYWLTEREGYTIKEASAKMNVSPSTLHDWIKRLKAECITQYSKE